MSGAYEREEIYGRLNTVFFVVILIPKNLNLLLLDKSKTFKTD